MSTLGDCRPVNEQLTQDGTKLPASVVTQTPILAGNKSLAVRPERIHQMESSIDSYKMFVSLVFSVSIFGASTFAVMAGQMQDPADLWKPDPPPFTMATVRNFLGIAWLCFILTIAVAGYSSSMLTIFQQDKDSADEAWFNKWEPLGILASTAQYLLLITAFLFLSLAMVSYAYIPGWVAVGFVCLAGLFPIILSMYQIRTHLRKRREWS